jgi:hypothetical protein
MWIVNIGQDDRNKKRENRNAVIYIFNLFCLTLIALYIFKKCYLRSYSISIIRVLKADNCISIKIIKTAFSIGELAELSGVKQHTIRIWEKRYRLLLPQRDRNNLRFPEMVFGHLNILIFHFALSTTSKFPKSAYQSKSPI